MSPMVERGTLDLLEQLLSNRENEILEFKEAKTGFDFKKLGKYFSALSNEANLAGKTCAWLIFGIRDKDHAVVGTDYRNQPGQLDSLKKEIADQTTERISFIDILEVEKDNKRVVLFKIPPAPRSIPVAFQGHYYAREGESVSALNPEKVDRIRAQQIEQDWSAVVVEEAGLEDLDPEALRTARENYLSKFPNKQEEAAGWDDITFLNKAKLTKKGKITRAALLLLGREEAEHFLNPAEAKIRWILRDVKNEDKDYDIFSMPLLLAVDKVHEKIRNLKYRYLKDRTLFPEEVLRYEPFVIREAINNCIAHQDYTASGRINVVEYDDDRLVFTNYGCFIPESVEKVVLEDAPEEQYRNPFLVTAMFNLKMVDTAGGGIRKMFQYQRERFFPMPEYDLSEKKVKLTITGKILDIEFARVLSGNPDLSFQDIFLLDSVQKRKRIKKEAVAHLRKLGFIEGRAPNYFLSSSITGKTSDESLKAQYIKHRGFDDDHYKKMILDYIKEYGSASRNAVDELLLDKLSDALSKDQKINKISNLLASLRKDNKILNDGSKKKPCYKENKNKYK